MAEEKIVLTEALGRKRDAQNAEHVGNAEIFCKELERRQTEIQSHQETLLQLKTFNKRNLT